MIYVQQVRNRKETLVPKSTDDMIEVLSVVGDISNMMTIDSDQYLEMTGSPESPDSSPSGVRPRKRAKLDHLSAEEKSQHRKMMNRISAQSARDRQKAQMQLQEIQIKNLVTSNDNLKKENQDLSSKCSGLVSENERLSSLLKEYEAKVKLLESTSGGSGHGEIKHEPEETKYQEEVNTENVSDSSLEPAVPRTVPLPKGPELLKNFSGVLLLLTCFQWILTHPNSSKHLKTSLSKSLAQEISSHEDLKKPSRHNQLLIQLLRHMKHLKENRVTDPG